MRNAARISLSLALVACNAAPSGTVAAQASSTAAQSASAPPSASSSATAALPPPAANGAPALSARGAKALAEDRDQRIDAALKGVKPVPKYETVEDTFVVIAGEPSAPLDEAVKLTRETAQALLSGPFQHRPEQAVTVWVTTSATARDAVVKRHAPGVSYGGIGFYDDDSRQIFFALASAGWGSLSHEIVHPLVLADMPRAPWWILEGIPAVFEVAGLSEPGVIRAAGSMRLQTLRTALASPKTAAKVRLDTLFTLTTRDAFVADQAFHYAQSREALRWMLARGQLWNFYAAFRDGVLEDPTGVRAFQTAMQKTPAEATADWVAWLQSPESEGMVP